MIKRVCAMPIDPDFFVEPAVWSHDQAELLAVREAVFECEQGVPREEEQDGLDPFCRHVIARARRHAHRHGEACA